MKRSNLARNIGLKRGVWRRTRSKVGEASPRDFVSCMIPKRRAPSKAALLASMITDKRLDDLCREIVFARDGYACVRCGVKCDASHWDERMDRFVYPGLHWSHVDSRRYKSVRWNPINSTCMCQGCHWWWHNPRRGAQPHRWFAETYPDREAKLNLIAATAARGAPIDRMLTRIALLQDLAAIAPAVAERYRIPSIDTA